MKCWKCGFEQNHNGWFCQNPKCKINLYAKAQTEDSKIRRPLTDHEKVKLSWYRDEKKWIDNIQDRRITRDKDGNKITVSQGKVLPMQPEKYWPKPKGVE